MEKSTNKITNEQIDQLILESIQPMNSLGIQIPYSYFSKIVRVNWYDILFAVRNIYLPLKSVIEHAMREIEENPNYHEAVFELAILSPEDMYSTEDIGKNIEELAEQVSDEDKHRVNEKILYVLLNWIFEHQGNYVDPLRVVEIIYDDFNFPESIKKFVRYEPSMHTILGSKDQNIKRLYSNWQDYLREEAIKYAQL